MHSTRARPIDRFCHLQGLSPARDPDGGRGVGLPRRPHVLRADRRLEALALHQALHLREQRDHLRDLGLGRPLQPQCRRRLLRAVAPAQEGNLRGRL